MFNVSKFGTQHTPDATDINLDKLFASVDANALLDSLADEMDFFDGGAPATSPTNDVQQVPTLPTTFPILPQQMTSVVKPAVSPPSASTSSASSNDGDSGSEHSSEESSTLRKRPAKPAPVRKPWKRDIKFLVKSITSREREQLKKAGITPPPAGTTSISKSQESKLRSSLRRIRNVASAQKSRQAQKEYIGELEEHVDTLENRVKSLTDENKSLYTQLEELRAMLLLGGTPNGQQAVFMIALCCAIVAGPMSLASILINSDTSSLAPTTFRSRTLQSVENDSTFVYTTIALVLGFCLTFLSVTFLTGTLSKILDNCIRIHDNCVEHVTTLTNSLLSSSKTSKAASVSGSTPSSWVKVNF